MILIHNHKQNLRAEALITSLKLLNIPHAITSNSVRPSFYISHKNLELEDPYTIFNYLLEKYPSHYRFSPDQTAQLRLLFLQIYQLLEELDKNADQTTFDITQFPLGQPNYLLGKHPHLLDGVVYPLLRQTPDSYLAAPYRAYKNRIRGLLKGASK